MTEAAERLKSALTELPPEDRAELVDFLIDSLDPETDAEFEAELERRGKEIESGTAVGEPAEQVFAQLREKLTNGRIAEAT